MKRKKTQEKTRQEKAGEPGQDTQDKTHKGGFFEIVNKYMNSLMLSF